MKTDYIAQVETEAGLRSARSLFDDRRHPLHRSGSDAAAYADGSIVRVARGEVTLLATPGSSLARVYEVLARYQVDPEAGSAARAEVAAIVDSPGVEDGTDDLTHLPFVTIDNEDSRDLDQALFIEPREVGGFRVFYALADASYYVQPGTALFEEAIARGSSFYMPSVCAPMLPPELSEGLVSLNPGVTRRALTLVMEVGADGTCEGSRLIRGRIRSRAKLSYEGVQAAFHANDFSELPGADEYEGSLRALAAFGQLRGTQAAARGVMQFTRLEARLSAHEQTPTFGVHTRGRNEVERWNEELSLLTNIEGARLLQQSVTHALPNQPVFRVHLPPEASRLDELAERIQLLVDRANLDDLWRWDRDAESLSDYLRRLPITGADARMQRAVERQARYTFQASEFSARVGPHHALAVAGYARVSSPMREVVGVFTHKELLEGLAMEEAPAAAVDEALRERVIDAGNRARRLQRRLEKEVALFAITDLFQADLSLEHAERPWREGTVLGVRSTRVNIGLDAFPIDLKLYRKDLEAREGCAYHADEIEMCPIEHDGPVFRIGAAVRVRVASFREKRKRYVLDAETM